MALGKALAAPLLLFTLVLYLIILGIAGWALNRFLDNQGGPTGSNNATFTFVLLSLIAGVVGVASALTGLHHLKAWRGESGTSAASSALIAWLLTLLALGLACKEIHISKFRGARLKALEAFVIITAFFQLLYLLILHAGLHNRRFGPGYSDAGYGTGTGHHKGNAAPAV